MKKETQSKGFTLVELIITITLLLISVTLALTVTTYINKSTNLITYTANVQENVRMAKSFIDQNLRGAKRIEIFKDLTYAPDDPYTLEKPDPTAAYDFAFYQGTDGVLYKRSNKDGAITALIGELGTGYNMSVLFGRTSDSFVSVKVNGDFKSDYAYELSSDLLLLGINPDQFLGTSGTIIGFNK